MATVDDKTGDTLNIFRINVSGDTSLTNVRYLAGFYDERAVETFFNETKSTTIDATNFASLASMPMPRLTAAVPCKDPASAECKTATDDAAKLVPLGSKSGDGGAFVLLLSTNPDAIVSTIGAFVDDTNVVSATMALVTKPQRDAVSTINATRTTVTNERSAIATELDQLIKTGEGNAAIDSESYLSALSALAGALAPGAAPLFTSIPEAKAWFAAMPRGAR